MRVLGLDVGSKTIGVAVSDELGLCAHPQKTLDRRGTKADVLTVQALCKAHGTREVVVGLPYDCEGKEGHRASRVRVLGDAIAATGLTVHYQDESYSTVTAERVLLEADLSRARRKQVIDKMAAAVILQAWLDGQAAQAGGGAESLLAPDAALDDAPDRADRSSSLSPSGVAR